MPRKKTNHWNDEVDGCYFHAAKVSLRKRLALLSFFDSCFYSMAFCLLTVMPVNAAIHAQNNAPDINIYAAHLSQKLNKKCEVDGQIDCQFNVIDQASLLNSLLRVSSDTHENVAIIDSLQNNDYELLIGSAIIKYSDETQSSAELVFEASLLWRGITIDDRQLSINLNDGLNIGSLELDAAALELLNEWAKTARKQKTFSAEYLYSSLGASDYLNELKVPSKIGNFTLARQHLFNDPMKGMLTRYIHEDFDLAVLDVYVYPLKTNLSLEKASQNELLLEQQDIQLISKSLGENALNMTDISEVKDIEGIGNIKIYGFEATLKTQSDPMYATQYVFVKNDKVVRLSANVPARIAKSLIALAVNTIEVPAESLLMKQVRQIDVEQLNRSDTVNVAP